MARKPRYFIPDVPQHVIQRGNNRSVCFFAETDYQRYRDDLQKTAAEHGCAVHAYVFMTNHVHLLMTPQEPTSLPTMMQALGRRYVRYINGVYGRTGTLWEGRYKASLVQSEHYLLCCYRYIELNPIRAGMIPHPALYPWSSFRFNGEARVDALITPHPQYLALGRDSHERSRAYKELFHAHLDGSLLNEIRTTLNQEYALGGDRFKDEIERHLERRVRPGQPGRPTSREQA